MVWQLPLSSPEHQTRERELKPTALAISTGSHCFLHQTAERVFRLKKHGAIMPRTAETERARKAAMELGWIDLPEAKRVSFPVACRHCATAMLEKGPTKFSGRTKSDKIRNGMVGCTTYGRSASFFACYFSSGFSSSDLSSSDFSSHWLTWFSPKQRLLREIA